ncbi:LOW QUALITY PROTEIN: transmembrane protein 186 [Nylanderia fulva]|uniref:LOW QUALITY PROTEIN: transmembrane protein 186 n=1 Tax=Nylanderia fulva TaxID=613905 RepID=UPI0010FB6CF9|nr:LOW QUALITY PROTEIN: transmembrane protein 186 [Nylanderia fulva]
MYFRLLTKLCERSLYRTSSNVRPQISRLCHAAEKEEKQEIEITSERFPDYKVIYIFPYIKYASLINLVKHKMTIFIGAAVPVVGGLCLTNIVSFDTAVSAIASGVYTIMWLHSFGILCNNLVGYVYMNLDKQTIILSYTDYWGKRIDMETNIHEIIPISDNPISITDFLYKKVRFSSQEKKLKITLKLGRIIDKESFTCTLGTIQ